MNNEKASVIDLSFKDNSTQRAEDILSMLISVYNENWVKDKNQIAVSTSMFINERLGVIEQELGDILIWTLANIRLTKSIGQLQSEQKTNK